MLIKNGFPYYFSAKFLFENRFAEKLLIEYRGFLYIIQQVLPIKINDLNNVYVNI